MQEYPPPPPTHPPPLLPPHPTTTNPLNLIQRVYHSYIRVCLPDGIALASFHLHPSIHIYMLQKINRNMKKG